MVALAAALILSIGLADHAGAAARRPSVSPVPKKVQRHAHRGPRPSGHPRARAVARTSDAVAIIGGPVGNYGTQEFRGCSNWFWWNGGYYYTCRYDFFFGGESQFTIWDYYRYVGNPTYGQFYGKWRCDAARYGGSCRWV
jgi:hypothetical protein